MNKPNYTPGPWIARGDNVYANRPHPVSAGANEESVFAAVRPYGERAANAALIAAAPDLFAVAESVAKFYGAFSARSLSDVEAEILESARAALAKAGIK